MRLELTLTFITYTSV